MEIKPIYVFYGEERFLLQKDVAFFREYFQKEDCITENFDGGKISLEEILLAAQSNPLFGEKRLIIVDNAPWFIKAGVGEEGEGAASVSKKKTPPPPYEKALLSYLENPNENVCLVFLAMKADKRIKITKAADAVGTVREYKPLSRWELPDYLRRYLRKQGKSITGRGLELFLSLSGEEIGTLLGEAEKLLIYVGDRNAIEEEDVYRVVSLSAEASSFQLSDAIGRRDLKEVQQLSSQLVKNMKPGEYMSLFGFITNYLRILIRVKEMMEQGLKEGAMVKVLGIHAYRVKMAIPAGKKYTMEELLLGLQAFMEVEFKVKSGKGNFEDMFPPVLISLIA